MAIYPQYSPYQSMNLPQQPMYQQPMYQPYQQQSFQSSQGINWVQGEIGAKAYPVGTGNSVLLMDSEGQYFYIKTTDASGMPTLRKYAYSEVVETQPKLEQSHGPQDYDTAKLASREEVKSLQEEVNSLKAELENLRATKSMNTLPAVMGGN